MSKKSALRCTNYGSSYLKKTLFCGHHIGFPERRFPANFVIHLEIILSTAVLGVDTILICKTISAKSRCQTLRYNIGPTSQTIRHLVLFLPDQQAIPLAYFRSCM